MEAQNHDTLCKFHAIVRSNRWRERIRNPHPLNSASNWFPQTVVARKVEYCIYKYLVRKIAT